MATWFSVLFIGRSDFIYDNYEVSVSGEIWHECVPEPATMSMLALGGLALLRRRHLALR